MVYFGSSLIFSFLYSFSFFFSDFDIVFTTNMPYSSYFNHIQQLETLVRTHRTLIKCDQGTLMHAEGAISATQSIAGRISMYRNTVKEQLPTSIYCHRTLHSNPVPILVLLLYSK